MGINRGSGVTHLAIMLGNYVTAKLRRKTAILERNNTESFLELKESYEENANSNQELSYFKISGVTYYYDVRSDRVGELYSKDYEYIILDMGIYNEKQIEEFLKCNIKIIIGSFNPWKNKAFIHAIEKCIAYGGTETVKYLMQFGNDNDVHQIEKVYQISICATPFEPDPFLIHGCNFEFLEHLLQ